MWRPTLNRSGTEPVYRTATVVLLVARDVLQPEAEPAVVRVTAHRTDHEAGELNVTGATRELARCERGIPAAGDRGVEEKHREHARDRQRDHEPGRTRLPSHAESLAP